MRVVCENCGATYKIPDEKLTKEVNKATCRKCSFRMMIRRPGAQVSNSITAPKSSEANTVITGVSGTSDVGPAPSEENEWSEEAPTQMRAPELAPPAPPSKAAAPTSAPKPAPKPTPAPPAARDGEPTPKVLLPMFGALMGAAGTLLLAWNLVDSATQQGVGTFLGLFGALTVLWWGVGQLLKVGRVGLSIGVVVLAIVSGATTSLMTQALIKVETGTFAKKVAPAAAVSQDTKATEEELTGDEGDAGADVPTEVPDEPEAAPEPEPEPEPTPEPTPEPEPVADAEMDLPEDPFEDDADTRQAEEEARRAEAERQRVEAERQRAEAERQRLEAARAAEAAPAQPKMKKLPLTVVDTMLRSNFSVKRCFVAEKKRSGTLPKRVSVRFTILPSGSVQSSRVTNTDLKGGAMDKCLRRAFKAINFPAFQGQAMTMTYPFVL